MVVRAAQVAAYIGDSMLLSEAAVRFQNSAAPLLAAKAEHGFLRKGLAACHVTLADVQAQFAFGVEVSAGQAGPAAPSDCFWPSLHDFEPWHDALFWPAVNACPVFVTLGLRQLGKLLSQQSCCLTRLLCRAPQSAARWPARRLLLWPTTCSMAVRRTRRLRLLTGWQSWIWPCSNLLCLSLAPPSTQVTLALYHNTMS